MHYETFWVPKAKKKKKKSQLLLTISRFNGRVFILLTYTFLHGYRKWPPVWAKVEEILFWIQFGGLTLTCLYVT